MSLHLCTGVHACLAKPSCITGPPETCAYGPWQTPPANGQPRTAEPYIVHIPCAHISIARQNSLTQHKLKDKIIKNVKITTAEHSTKHLAFLSTIYTSYIPIKLAQHVCAKITNTVILNFIFVLQFYPHLTSWEIYRMQCDILRSLTT